MHSAVPRANMRSSKPQQQSQLTSAHRQTLANFGDVELPSTALNSPPPWPAAPWPGGAAR